MAHGSRLAPFPGSLGVRRPGRRRVDEADMRTAARAAGSGARFLLPILQGRHLRPQPKLRPHGGVIAPPLPAPFVMVSALDDLEVPRHERVIEAARSLALGDTVCDGSGHCEAVAGAVCILQPVT